MTEHSLRWAVGVVDAVAATLDQLRAGGAEITTTAELADRR